MTTSTATRTSAATEAWVLIGELFATSRSRFVAIASEFDLAPGQMAALKTLDPDAPMPMRDLAQSLACDNSNVTGIVDRLEERGLVERRASDSDRRVKMLWVTADGRRLRDQVKGRLETPPDALRDLSDEDAAKLRDLLRSALGHS